MKKSLLIAIAAATVSVASLGAVSALPINGGLKAAIDDIDFTERAAVYVVEGRRYCFYFDGWKGPGWPGK